MKIIGVIPARLGSTRIKEKPLLDICGKTLIQRVFERCSSSKYIDAIYVATDSKKIFDVVKKFGGKPVMTSSIHRSGSDRICEVVKGKACNIVINIQGDEPLIPPSLLNRGVRFMIKNPDVNVLSFYTKISSQEAKLPENVKVVLNKKGSALFFSRSPIPYSGIFFKHIGLYMFRKDFLLKFCNMCPSNLEKIENLEQLRILENGYSIRMLETRYNPISIDTPEDLKKIRKILKKSLRGK